MRNGRWRRIYLGKHLDTSRYVTPDGSIDWERITHRRPKRTPGEGVSHDAPGQSDMVDEHTLALPAPEVHP